eukprot:2769144-Rhodomonas_salina.1
MPGTPHVTAYCGLPSTDSQNGTRDRADGRTTANASLPSPPSTAPPRPSCATPVPARSDSACPDVNRPRPASADVGRAGDGGSRSRAEALPAWPLLLSCRPFSSNGPCSLPPRPARQTSV